MFLARAPFLRWQQTDRPLIGLNCLQPFGFNYPYTNGGADATVLPDARLTKIKDTGFDFVRLAVDPETLLFADSASNVTTTVLDSRIAEIITGIARRTALGLKVMVDIHFHGALVTVQSGWQYTDVFDSGTKSTRLGFVLARLAAAIHAARTTCSSGMVCIEIFNEPPSPALITTASYITHIESWWAQTRAAAPLHTIVVGGNNLNAIDGTPAGSASGLTSLTASHFDANTAFSIHRYEPPVFTHQDVTGNLFQYMLDLKFPTSTHPGGQSAAEASFTSTANSEGDHDGVTAASAIDNVVTQTTFYSSLNKAFSTYGSETLLKTYQDVATNWASSAGLSNKYIFNTEIGVNFVGATDATETSAAAWVSAMRNNAFASNIGCLVIHEMQGSDFGIQNTSNPWAFNSSIQTALFP